MTLSEIVDQLRRCHYECEAGRLEDNVAFVELERIANEAAVIVVEPRQGETFSEAAGRVTVAYDEAWIALAGA